MALSAPQNIGRCRGSPRLYDGFSYLLMMVECSLGYVLQLISAGLAEGRSDEARSAGAVRLPAAIPTHHRRPLATGHEAPAAGRPGAGPRRLPAHLASCPGPARTGRLDRL